MVPRCWRLSRAKATAGPADHADHDAVAPAGDLPLERAVVVEVVVHDRLALRGAHQPGAQADQAAGGDREFEVGVGALASILLISPRRAPTSSITGPMWPWGTSTTRNSYGS